MSKNANATSELSESSSTFIPYTVPGTPAISSVVAGNASASIYYTDGSANGRAITEYKVSLNNGEYTDVSAAYPIVLSGLTNGTSYTALLKAVNLAGSSLASVASSAFIPYTVPSAPTLSSVVAGNTTATVQLTAGNTNGSAIIAYWYSVDGTHYSSTSSTNTTITITGLTNGTTYSITVKAENAAGLSGASTAVSDVIPYTTPGAPTISSVLAGNAGAVVYFTNGANNGRTITQYQYTYITGGVSTTATTATSTSERTTIILTGLTNWSTYTIRIKAINAAGMSDASESSDDFVPYSIPGAPVISSVVPGNASLTVNMDETTIDAGVIGVRYSLNNTSSFVYLAGGGTSFTISSGVENAVAYTVYVKTVTSLGDSATSSPSSPATPYTVPSAPSITSVVAGNTTASIYVSDGSNNGSEITHYAYSTDGDNYTQVSYASPIALTSLTNWSSYSFYVKAINAAGSSAASGVSSSITPYLLPTSCTISSITAGDSQITVEIGEYTATSGIIGYKYSFTGTEYTYVASAAATFTITGLTNGQSYNVYVKSVTTAGDSPASSISSSVSPRTVPSAPTSVVATPFNECASIAFVDGSANGATIEYYIYSLNGDIDVPVKKRSDGTIKIFGLTNASQYTVRLRAVNTIGTSDYSVESNTFIPYGAPLTPTITQILPGNGCVYVYFDEIDNNGDIITKMKYSLGASLFDGSGLTSPMTISGLTNKTTYTISIAATNAGGDSTTSTGVSITVGVPNAPVITSVVPSAKKLLVYFDVPGDNGSAITQYSYGLVGSKTYTKVSSLLTTSASPVQVVNLQNGTAYNVVLVAVNKNGTSAISNSVGAQSPRDVPTRVSITSVTALYDGAMIYFTAPAINGSAITGYKYALNTSTEYTDASGTTLPLRIYNISPNTINTVKIIATNSAGDSIVSVASKPFTYVYLPPSQVKITALAITISTLTVSFTAPAINGSAITGYKYALNNDTTFTDASGTSLPLVIRSGISPNTSYNVRIIAVNAAGESTASLAATKAVSFTYLPPLAPTVSSITNGTNSVSVVFVAPAARGAAITGYAYCLDASGTVYYDVSGATSPMVISELSNNVLYTVRIAAITAAGYSALSVAKTVTPVYKVPDKPVITTVTAGSAKLTVAFTVPAANGSPITGYKYTLNGGSKISADLSTAGTTFIITKNVVNDADVALVAGTAYSVQMYATNSLGDSEVSLAKSGTPKV